MLPDGFRVQYHIYLTSGEVDATFVLISPRLEGHLPDVALEAYMEHKVGGVIKELNCAQGATDFRTMTAEEVDSFVRGTHKHSPLDPEEYASDTGYKH